MRYLVKIFLLLFVAAALPAQNPSAPESQADTVYVNARICARQWCSGAIVSGINFGAYEGYFHLQPDGCYLMDTTLELTTLNMSLFKNDDPLNGMDILELIGISNHILGLEPISNPFSMIAVDINKSNSITTFDIVESRRMLTGVYDSFPNNQSWRFVDANHVFPNPNNPFQGGFPEMINQTPVNDTIQEEFNFWAIKIGDPDCSANPAFASQPDARSVAYLQVSDRWLQPGEVAELPVSFAAKESWLGFQFGLQYDPGQLVLEEVLPGALPNWDAYTTAQPRPGQFNLLWFDTNPVELNPKKPIVTLRVRALRPVLLSQAIQLSGGRLRSEAFTAASEGRNLQLEFTSGASVGVRVGPAQPNPTKGGAWLPVELPEPTSVDLTIYDLQGRLLWSRSWASVGGLQQVELPETAFPAAGTYLWRLVTGAGAQAGRLVVER